MSRDNLKSPRLQNGAVLAVSLLILVVLTIIGVSSMTTTSLEEKMSGNFRDRQIAFNAAEAALSHAENFINASINSASVFDGTNGLYASYTGPSSGNVFDSSWWTGTAYRALPITGTNSVSEVNTQPRYTIEHRGEIGELEGTSVNLGGYGESTGGGEITGFRITVRATGLTDNSVVYLQSYYGKRL